MTTVVTTPTPNGSVTVVTAPPGSDEAHLETIIANARNALTNNQAYLAIPTPTQNQAIAQVQALTQQIDGVIRFLIGALDATT